MRAFHTFFCCVELCLATKFWNYMTKTKCQVYVFSEIFRINWSQQGSTGAETHKILQSAFPAETTSDWNKRDTATTGSSLTWLNWLANNIRHLLNKLMTCIYFLGVHYYFNHVSLYKCYANKKTKINAMSDMDK